ncbi:hypothetical protein [Gracilibacillus phocaeensis]|uniref:hypothetical protein n=1 Tax=Gracilibacillus phocaeensis TaxID=2042304 RepID=UPI0010302867|nr:hypothetical protein [Gracilibacillus phocaeensis]
MSWKAVEMQIALPRTQEAGRIQQQLQQQPQTEQQQLTEQITWQDKQKRTQVQKQTNSERVKQNDVSSEQMMFGEDRDESANVTSQLPHPYLGHTIDLMK